MKKKISKFIIIFVLAIFSLSCSCFASITVYDDKIETFPLENSHLSKDIEENVINKNISQNIAEKEYSELNNKKFLKARSLTQGTELYNIYSNYEPIFMENDKENIYYLSYYKSDVADNKYTLFEISKQNIATKENTKIIGKGQFGTIYQDEPYYPVAYYTLGNVIYIECVIREEGVTAYNQVTVFGVDITSNSVVYQKEFNVTVDIEDRYCSFAVDNNQRFYFVNDFTEIVIYNNEGNIHYDSNITLGETGEVIINSVSPDGKVLFFSINQYRKNIWKYSIYQGMQELEDGKFVEKSSYTVSDSYGKDPLWHFIDENNEYAINQYGDIVEFNYDEGISYTVIATASKLQYDYYYGDAHKWPLYVIYNNYVYIMGSDNQLFIFDRNNNFEYVGRINVNLSTDENQEVIENITINDKQVNILYSVNYTEYKTLYLKTINLDEQIITEKKNITYNTHISQTHTESEIKTKFNASYTFNYSNSPYKSEPSIVVPYYEGELQEGVINDALNRLNFYRWMYGINELTLNSDKMARNQKGALIQKVNDVLTHFPTKPNGMTDEFFGEAYAGCNSNNGVNDTYSGNCAYMYSPLNMHIDGYVDDINNVSENTSTNPIGHRWSLLDPNAHSVSFGFVEPYSTVSMYYDEEIELNEDFYSLPTAGNFPTKLFKTNERWSLYFTDEVNFGTNYKLELIYNGKSYNAKDIRFEEYKPAITFLMPDELMNTLGGKGKTMPECTITVKLTGVTNCNLDNVIYQYDVNFFNIAEDLLKGDVNKDGVVKLYDALQILRQSILNSDLTDEMLYIMDYNDDGVVALYDALMFLRQAILS